MTAHRLPPDAPTRASERIDRTQPLSFTWDGKALRGYAGDTLASALLANDIYLIGRSFKYHRPRGILSAGVEESGALVTLGDGARRDPNVKATCQELFDGLAAYGQNAWPNVRLDIGALNNLFGRFLAAGFYYKTFMGPRLKFGRHTLGGTALWMQFEKFIRRAAGMGTASRQADPDCYEHAHDFCDVLVIGSGPAGLAAAAHAARAGLEVLLAEQDYQLGGNLLSQATAQEKRTELIAQARKHGVRFLPRTTAFGIYDGAVVGLLERVTDHLSEAARANTKTTQHQPRQRFRTVRAKHIIVAAGALERSIAFGNNDRPGVMSASAAQTYLNRYGVLPGRRIALATNNDSAYAVANDLAHAGAQVMLLDARPRLAKKSPTLQDTISHPNIQLRMGCAPLDARTGMGVFHARRVSALRLATATKTSSKSAKNAAWQAGKRVPCDLIAISGGWSPVINLVTQRNARARWDARLACFLPPALDKTQPISVAGSAAGIWNTEDCEASGVAAAKRALSMLSNTAVKTPPRPPTAGGAGGWQNPIHPLYEVRVCGKKLKCWVDPQHDVTTDDVRLAKREGFVSVEHLKRYTTLGMATDGGKMGNVIALALMAEALGKEIPQLGVTTFRPPYTPISLGALRGRNVAEHFRPLRRTPMHAWNLTHGATMTMAGLWHRPWYFAQQRETLTQAYIREATTVRQTLGLCDVTSLGKIALQGPDTTQFLDRIYANRFAKLPIGKARYGIMLRDDGMVLDDGTTWRLAENEYFMTTTTAHAGKVMAWLEELLHTRWSEYRVQATSVTDQWAGCALAGPQSRAALRACLAQTEQSRLTDQSLPFMGVVTSTLRGGIPCRIARISFSGELAYEVYVPSDFAVAMMDLLWRETETRGGCLYGLEALGTLRIEKGHVTGAELDGRVTIDDIGLSAMLSPQPTYIGAALRNRPALQSEQRARLVGIRPRKRTGWGRQTFNAGAILCRTDASKARRGKRNSDGNHGIEGWVTAVTHSPALGYHIGLGFINGGVDAWHGKLARAADPVRKKSVLVEIIDPRMVDPENKRLHG